MIYGLDYTNKIRSPTESGMFEFVQSFFLIKEFIVDCLKGGVLQSCISFERLFIFMSSFGIAYADTETVSSITSGGRGLQSPLLA